jgi:hypothetical protein
VAAWSEPSTRAWFERSTARQVTSGRQWRAATPAPGALDAEVHATSAPSPRPARAPAEAPLAARQQLAGHDRGSPMTTSAWHGSSAHQQPSALPRNSPRRASRPGLRGRWWSPYLAMTVARSPSLPSRTGCPRARRGRRGRTARAPSPRRSGCRGDACSPPRRHPAPAAPASPALRRTRTRPASPRRRSMPRLRGRHDEPRELLEAPPVLLDAQVLRSAPHGLAD